MPHLHTSVAAKFFAFFLWTGATWLANAMHVFLANAHHAIGSTLLSDSSWEDAIVGLHRLLAISGAAFMNSYNEADELGYDLSSKWCGGLA